MRGMRTLGVRLAQHEKNALEVANWLAQREDVDHVRHPALASCPGNEFFERDFQGSCGLFSFVMKGGNQAALTALLDGMEHFKMGYSWGGYESLIMGVNGVDKLRTATQWKAEGTLIRVHIGLEDTSDLIADLEAGLARFNAAL
jgi:cystathionine beta-lyase